MKNYKILCAFLCLLVYKMDAQCILPSLVDPNVSCTTDYDPICGCDNKTYSNSCAETTDGISKYYNDECGGNKFPLTVTKLTSSTTEPSSYEDRNNDANEFSIGQEIHSTIFFTSNTEPIILHFYSVSPKFERTLFYSSDQINPGNDNWYYGSTTPSNSGIWSTAIEIELSDGRRQNLAVIIYEVQGNSSVSCLESDFTQEVINTIYCSDTKYEGSNPTLECHWDNNNPNVVVAKFDYLVDGSEYSDLYNCQGELISSCPFNGTCVPTFDFGDNYFFCGGLETIELSCQGAFDQPWIRELACSEYFPRIILDEFTTGIQVSLWLDGNDRYYSFKPSENGADDFYDAEGNFITNCFLITTSQRPSCTPSWSPIFDLVFSDYIVYEDCGMAECSSPRPDYAPLMSLYESTNGENWTNNDGWREGASGVSCDPCNWNGKEWEGIICNGEGRVTEIFLPNNNMTGNLPTDLDQLSNLKILSLENNSIGGSIPSSMASMSSLEEVYLADNQITDGIGNTIGSSNIQVLSLNNNPFTPSSIPNSIGDMSQLRLLYLFGCNLIGQIPEEIGNLSNIEILSLGGNNLSGCIPESMRSMCNGVEVTLLENPQLPWEGDFSRFCNLDAPMGGELTGGPFSFCVGDDVADMIAQNEITLSGNSGENSQWIVTDSNGIIVGLSASYNDMNFDGLEIGIYFIWHVSFNGELIGAILDSNINDIDGCYSLSNSLTANSMECIEDNSCRTRDSLALVALYNSTDGENWKNKWELNNPINEWNGIELNPEGCVQNIFLKDNGLKGVLPDSIGNLSELADLDLQRNALSGAIPSSIGKLLKVHSLRLSNNEITGQLPDSLGYMESLTQLLLSNNKLVDEIPESFGELSNLITFAAWNNKLSGEIPDIFDKMENLSQVALMKNNLSGTFPESLAQNNNIRVIGLSNNNIEGELPIFTNGIEKLDLFWLNNNQFSGCIPESYSSFCQMEELDSSSCTLAEELNIECLGPFQLENNPALTFQGDVTQFCSNQEQFGSSCDDGDSTTTSDQINENCECVGVSDCGDCPDEQVELLYSADNEEPMNGDMICYSIEVSNFVSMVQFFFSVTYSSSSLRYNPESVVLNSTLPSFTSGDVVQIDPSIVAILWAAPNVRGECLEDDSQLLELCFEVIGDPGDALSFDITSDGNNGNVSFISRDFNMEECNVSTVIPTDGPKDATRFPSEVAGEDAVTVPINNLVISNIITPNGDGINDVLQFSNDSQMGDSELFIYNRWGNQIYHTKEYSNDWDAQGYPDGTYFYVLLIGEEQVKSTITVSR